MRPIDADELKNAIVEEGQRSKRYKLGETWELNRDEIWKVVDEQPTVEPAVDYRRKCEELKAGADHYRRENNMLRGEIKALAFAVRCNGVSGNDVRYGDD